MHRRLWLRAYLSLLNISLPVLDAVYISAMPTAAMLYGMIKSELDRLQYLKCTKTITGRFYQQNERSLYISLAGAYVYIGEFNGAYFAASFGEYHVGYTLYVGGGMERMEPDEWWQRLVANL